MFDRIVEGLLRIMAWAVQIGAVLLVAWLLATVVRVVEEAIRKKQVRLHFRFLVVLLLVCVLLAALAINPIVSCTAGTRGALSSELEEAVQDGAAGLYSWNIPLVPVVARVNQVRFIPRDGATECKIEYTVYYFCFGSLQMEYSTLDGYNAWPSG